jgi:uncharacterized protein YjbI with pentapeptide repeats
LSNANLSNANLSNANLSWAYLLGANLEQANLANANLSWAALRGANLESANLESANLESANLESANLSGVDLHSSNLAGASGCSIVGTPAALPSGWELVEGCLLHTGANAPEAVLQPADSDFDTVVRASSGGRELGSVDTVLSSPVSFTPLEPLNFPLWNRGALSLATVQDRGIRFKVTVTNTMDTNLDLSSFRLGGVSRSGDHSCRWLTGGAFTDEQVLGYPAGDDGFTPVTSLEPGQTVQFDAALACQVRQGTELEIDLKFATDDQVAPRIFRTTMP